MAELRIEPILPRFGAEISGVDITQPLDEATQAAIRAAQNQWGVTVWRNTGLTDETHVAFSRIFGEVMLAPRIGTMPPKYACPELFDASNIDREGNILDDERTRILNRGNRLWHTDSSFMPSGQRAAQSLLLCHEAPPEGGPTWFADTRGAYEDLPEAMKARLAGLEAEHNYFWSRRRAGYPVTEEQIAAMPRPRHALVHRHLGSGRLALYIGSHAKDIAGLPSEEGRPLLDELLAHATQPAYVFSVEYRPGDLVIWDNLCSMHRGGDFDDTRHRRDMRRTTIYERDHVAAPEMAAA